MRKLGVAVAFLLVSTAAVAQQDKPTAIYVFITNAGFTYSERSGSDWEGAFGVALQRMFTPHVSAEVSVSRDRRFSRLLAFDPNGNVIDGYTRTITHDFTPVDLTARYHFLNGSAWKPYAGIGVRYVESRAVGDLTGGVVWQFRPSLGLRFDAKVLLGNQPRFTDTINGRPVWPGGSDQGREIRHVAKLVHRRPARTGLLVLAVDPRRRDAEGVAGDDVVKVALRGVQPSRAADPPARGGEVRGRRFV
jgi:hypothetical protein